MSWTCENVTVLEDEPLANKTTWGIGGVARYYAEPRDSASLAGLLREARVRNIRTYTLGGGSNLLIRDGVLNGLVVRLPRDTAFGNVYEATSGKRQLRVGAAMSLAKAVELSVEEGLGGLEPLAGIPGTVGGAVVMNAGSALKGIGEYVESISGVDAGGRLVHLSREQLVFGYRTSNLTDLILTEIEFYLRLCNPEDVRRSVEEFRAEKTKLQPLGKKSAGCVFRNPPNHPAGWLIDQAGLKGCACGDAVVSEQHANFIINRGEATYADTKKLIDHVRKTVREEFGIEMSLEVHLWL